MGNFLGDLGNVIGNAVKSIPNITNIPGVPGIAGLPGGTCFPLPNIPGLPDLGPVGIPNVQDVVSSLPQIQLDGPGGIIANNLIRPLDSNLADVADGLNAVTGHPVEKVIEAASNAIVPGSGVAEEAWRQLNASDWSLNGLLSNIDPDDVSDMIDNISDFIG